MNTRTLTFLGIATAVAIFVAVLFSSREGGELPYGNQPVFPDLMANINDVAEISIAAQSGLISVVREGETWRVKEKSHYRANIGKVRETLLGLAELTILEAKTKNPDLYEKLGLKEVEAEGSLSTGITIKNGEGENLAALIVGNQRPAKGDPSRDEIYVRKPDGPQTWLTIGHLNVERIPGEWLDKEILDLEPIRLRRVHITHPDKTTLILEKEKPNDLDFTVVNLPRDAKIESQFTVNNIASTLSNLVLDDVREASDVSFDEQSIVKAVLETIDGLEATVKILRKDDKTYVTVAAVFNPDLVLQPESAKETDENKGGSDEGEVQKGQPKSEEPTIKSAEDVKAEVEALNEKLGGWVYIIPKFRADNILKKPEDLISKDS